ncbi:MAG: hypothetical protein M1817_001224 [Caeruleum heppii]|nr:MAG: hypothetical protein M1817_001224 [Caeruleum heppii]
MAPVAFQIISDLHLETQQTYSQFKLRQTAPYLALLGDIGYVGNDELFAFLQQQMRRYWAVFFVLGNHEPYNLSFPAAKERMRAFADRMEQLRAHSTIGRFVLLDQTRYDISDHLTILGCTLFSRILPSQAKEVAGRLSDFKYIQSWTVDEHIQAHDSDLAWLNDQVATITQKEPQRQIAVFTHYSPCLAEAASNPAHRESPVTSGFATDLARETCWMAPQVRLWAFGHTHYNCAFDDPQTSKRVLTNQRGYAMAPREGFEAKTVFLIGDG